MATVWRYTAVPRQGPARGVPRSGELAGESAAAVRASLRRAGLQAVSVTPRRTFRVTEKTGPLVRLLAERWFRHARSRRTAAKNELYDGLATMLDSGLPLLEAVETVRQSVQAGPTQWLSLPGRSSPGGRGTSRGGGMLTDVRERLRSGESLAEAMGAHPGWFDSIEVAMVRAGQHAGELSGTLRQLAERHERASELGHKVVGALAYPLIITLVGLGVVVFLSVRTLPDLVGILQDAEVGVPALTAQVIAFGRFIAVWWWVLGGLILLAIALGPVAAALVARREVVPTWLGRLGDLLTPRIVRRLAVANLAQRWSDLAQVGVPAVEALRVIVPTVRGPAFRAALEEAASRVERGDTLSESLDDPRWFDLEFRRLLDVGQTSGELDQLLSRIATR